MDLSIIIVAWNSRELLRKNLKTIYKYAKNLDFEVFCIDNASRDKTADMIKKAFPQVNAIFNDHNAGFAKANNQGIKKSSGRYVLLLNPDMEIKENTLEKMVKWMDKHPDAGVAGCHLVDKNNETVPHCRRFPTVWDQLAIIYKIPHIFPAVLNKYLWRDFDYSQEAEVDSLRGSFFMIRREVLNKLKGLDERYFLWFEEVDFCKQAKSAGWKIMYTPAAECIDYIGKSFARVSIGRSQKYAQESMIKYFKKWHKPWEYLLIEYSWPIGRAIALLADKFGLKSKART